MKASRKIFYGWKVLAAAAWLRALAGGFHSYAFTILFLPVSRDLNLSRTAASLIFALARTEGALEGPVAGYLIDRHGARRTMTIGCIIVGIGYLLLSRAYDFTTFLLVYILVICLGFGTAFMHSATALINHWFFRHRAISLAVISASMSLGGAIFSPIFSFIVHQSGWRSGAVLAGAVFLVLGLPATRLIFSTPESKGLIPLGSARPQPGTSPAQPPPIVVEKNQDFGVKEALKTNSFWLLVTGTLLRMFGFSLVTVHFVPILTWKGIPEPTAAYYLGLMAAASIPAHLCLGLAGDRWYRPRIASIAMALGTVGMLFLLLGGSKSNFVFLVTLAMVEGLFSVIWATVGDFFGRQHFATIRGFVTLFATWGSIVGPLFAGMVFDRTESYTLALQASLISFALSALIFWFLPHPRRWPSGARRGLPP